jgi:hypothetical protein
MAKPIQEGIFLHRLLALTLINVSHTSTTTSAYLAVVHNTTKANQYLLCFPIHHTSFIHCSKREYFALVSVRIIVTVL